MTRSVVATFFAVAAAIAIGACGDQYEEDASGGFSQPDCTQYTTCGACTWIVGCGWCFGATTGPEGICASGPEHCTKAGSRWNWEPIGCHVAADPRDGDR